MKIVCINAMAGRDKNPQGGIFVSQRVNALERQGIEVLPYVYDVEHSAFVKRILKIKDSGNVLSEQIGVHYHVVSVKYGFFEQVLSRVNTAFLWKKQLRKMDDTLSTIKDIDIIHLHWIWPFGLGVMRYARKKGIPYVVTCHGSDVNVLMKRTSLRKHMINILENAAAVEFVSHALLSNAVKMGYSGKNGFVVNNGIDVKVFYNKITDKQGKSVGYVGNLVSIKGADRLPDIFTGIKQQYEGEIEFVVVGSGVQSEMLKESMKALPVRFTGQISSQQLADEYRKMDILISPSRNEGFPCAIKEAQACGVIPVATDVGGVSEAVNGYGVLISESSEEKLKQHFIDEAIRLLKDDHGISKDEMIIRASEFSWDNRAKHSIAIYRKVLNGNED